jgi:peroxiredoxin
MSKGSSSVKACLRECHWMDHHLPNYFHAAPDFQLQSQTGSKVSLKDYKGERIILFFFGDHSSDEIGLAARNFATGPCKVQRVNASVIDISRTTSESNRVWAEKNGLTFTLLADPDQAIAKAYGVPAEVASSSGNRESTMSSWPRVANFDYPESVRHNLRRDLSAWLRPRTDRW